MRVDGVYFSVRLGGSVRAFVQVRDETVERTGSLRGLSQTAKWALFVSNMAASDGHVVCLLLVAGVGICVGGAEDVRRLDPGSDLTVTWAVDPAARLEQYDVINVTVNDSDVLLSCLPAVQRCEDVRAKDRSLRFVLVFADVAVDVSNASVSDVEANITNDDENSATKRADVIQVGFELRNVRVTDAGRYSLSLIIENSTDTEHRVVLYVYLPPTNPVVLGTLSEQKAGEEAALWCNKSLIQSVPVAYRDWSLLVYKWYRNDELIQKDQGPLIRLNLTKADDKASYRCSVQEGNSSIEASSDVFMLNVIYIDDVRLDVDEPMGLVCRSDCNPECSYRWLDASGTVLSNSSSLSSSEEISGVRLTCEASNKFGTTSQSGFVFRTTEIAFSLIEIVFCILIAVAFCFVLGGAAVLHKRRHKQRNQLAGLSESSPAPSSEAFDKYRRQSQQKQHSGRLRPEIQQSDAPSRPERSGSSGSGLPATPMPTIYLNVAPSVSGRHARHLERPETTRTQRQRPVTHRL